MIGSIRSKYIVTKAFSEHNLKYQALQVYPEWIKIRVLFKTSSFHQEISQTSSGWNSSFPDCFYLLIDLFQSPKQAHAKLVHCAPDMCSVTLPPCALLHCSYSSAALLTFKGSRAGSQALLSLAVFLIDHFIWQPNLYWFSYNPTIVGWDFTHKDYFFKKNLMPSRQGMMS